VISALQGTFEQKPFNNVLDLVPKCEKIKHLHAICKICYAMATYSLRLEMHEAGDLLIGGHDVYMPVCRECFVFKTKQMQDRKQINELKEVTFGEDGENLITI